MGWGLKAAVLLTGLVFIGAGLWPVGVLCFGYLAVSPRLKHSKVEAEPHRPTSGFPPRYVLGLSCYFISAIAMAAGGALSPVLFFVAGSAVLLWPSILSALTLPGVSPVEGSILLRSRYSPITWHAVAQVKAGPDPLPRSLSHLSGTLLSFLGSGESYFLVSCRALGKRAAEYSALSQLRSATVHSPSGAYLLPLDSASAAEVLSRGMKPQRLRGKSLPDEMRSLTGAIVLECQAGRVTKASAFETLEQKRPPTLPPAGKVAEGSPLVWEVLEALSGSTRWPEPDQFSNLLDSMAATRGIPMSERIRSLESSDKGVVIRSLGGAEVSLSRPQLRAIVTLYS